MLLPLEVVVQLVQQAFPPLEVADGTVGEVSVVVHSGADDVSALRQAPAWQRALIGDPLHAVQPNGKIRHTAC